MKSDPIVRCVVVAVLIAGLLVGPSSPLQAAPGNGLSYVPLDHWSYQAFYRLAGLGLVPLHKLSARPITRLEARRLVAEASARVRQAETRVASLAGDDLRRLAEEFSVDAPVTVRAGGTAGSRQSTDYAPDRSAGASWLVLWYAPSDRLLFEARAVASDDAPRSELYTSFQLGSVLGQAGRAQMSWGPSLRSSLLLSDNAGTLPLLRITAEIPRLRLTKVVASLDRAAGSGLDTALLVGTRLDWLVTPRFRLGLSESLITTWNAPLIIFHIIHPLPVLFSTIAANYLHDTLQHPHNTLASVDFDWLPRPGVRLYGGLMIDDSGGRLPLRHWRLGLLAGLHLLDPFRTGRTNLRLEYSLVTNGTYNYFTCCGLDYSYRGRSLGHWLGPDGDDLYLELTHQLRGPTTLQVWYSFTRHGQGRVGQPAPPGPEDWLLSGVVEHRHTLGLNLHQVHSPSLETRYRAELVFVTNRGNMAGAQATEGLLGIDLTYRWPVAPAGPGAHERIPQMAASPQSPVLSTMAHASPLSVRAWASSSSSRGPLSGPTEGTFLGIGYRRPAGSFLLTLAYDAAVAGDQSFWAVDLHYPLVRFPYGTISLFAGWGGLRFRGALGGAPQEVTVSAPRAGIDFFYRVPLGGGETAFYLAGDISNNAPTALPTTHLWTYSLGMGWQHRRVGLEAGYRGAAALWEFDKPNQTALRWDGFYFTVSIR